MAPSTYECTCGAVLRFRQDLIREQGEVYPTWKCKQCGTPVPGRIAEKLRHEHPS